MKLAILAMIILLAGCTGNPGPAGGSQPDIQNGSQVQDNTTVPQANATVDVTKLAESGLSMGSSDAPVMMVEFSDYQCQFCRRFWQVNFETLKKEYIDTGKVRFVYKDLPLEFHNAAEDSALAVACAEEQGMGWQMHDKIFSVQANVSTGLVFYAKSDLRQWAGEIGADKEDFDGCLDSGKYAGFVNESKSEALSLGMNAAPSFVIGLRNRSNYVTLTGALPYGTFKATIDQLLNASGGVAYPEEPVEGAE